MAGSKQLTYEPIRELDGKSISTGAYAQIGGPIEINASLIRFINDTHADVFISFDGINDHIFVIGRGSLTLDLTAHATATDGLFPRAGRPFFVKGVTVNPVGGSVWIEVAGFQPR